MRWYSQNNIYHVVQRHKTGCLVLSLWEIIILGRIVTSLSHSQDRSWRAQNLRFHENQKHKNAVLKKYSGYITVNLTAARLLYLQLEEIYTLIQIAYDQSWDADTKRLAHSLANKIVIQSYLFFNNLVCLLTKVNVVSTFTKCRFKRLPHWPSC